MFFDLFSWKLTKKNSVESAKYDFKNFCNCTFSFFSYIRIFPDWIRIFWPIRIRIRTQGPGFETLVTVCFYKLKAF